MCENNNNNGGNIEALRKNSMLRKILQGEYCEADICRLSSDRLNILVKQVQNHSGQYLTAANAINSIVPQWPSRRPIASVDRGMLKDFLSKCSNFFNKFSACNDENTCDGDLNGKRKRPKHCLNRVPNKRRKTLSLLDNGAQVPVIRLTDILQPVKPKVVLKDSFMACLGLKSTSDETHQVQSPQFKDWKMMNCLKIPISSNLGKRIIFNTDRYNMSSDLKIWRLEKSEWYINRSTVKLKEHNFEVTYSRGKSEEYQHYYTFPKRQASQVRIKLVRKKCLCVRLERLDLVALKAKYDRMKLKRLSIVVDNLNL